MPVPPNPLDLTGKHVVVTGGSSGIGRATAILLSELGARLTLVGRRAIALDETRMATGRPDAHTCQLLDLADYDAVIASAREWPTTIGAIDGLVHSAGVGGAGALRTLSRKGIDAVAGPNMYATLALLRAVASKGVAVDGSSVVVVSSAAALIGSAGLVAYSATKGAVQAIVRSAAVELKGRKIRVNAVAPGYVATPMMEQSRQSLLGFEAVEARQFLGVLEPVEVAAAVAYLLSDAAKRVTGTTLVIDGGLTV